MSLQTPGGKAEATRYQEALLQIMAAAREASAAAYEREGAETVIVGLAPQVLEIAEDATASLTELLETYEPGDPAASQQPAGARSYFLRVDELGAKVAARQRVADLAFLGRLELRRKAQALRALTLDGGDSWQLTAAAGSALRCTRKAITAVEAALCACEGLTPHLVRKGEVAASLAVRSAYAKFRFEIRCHASRQSTADLLLGASTSLAKLVGHQIYEALRLEDRLQIRELQQRILGWYRGTRESTSGRQLWQDIAGFAELMAGIRHRQELVRHDGELIEELLGRLRRGEEIEAGLPRLHDLLGRDDDLDELLLSSHQPGSEVIQVLLERFASESRGSWPGIPGPFID